ncbi:MAG: hypothetical protein ACTS77_00295 [Arsenophonus sp. NC-TX2-MAG3]
MDCRKVAKVLAKSEQLPVVIKERSAGAKVENCDKPTILPTSIYITFVNSEQ